MAGTASRSSPASAGLVVYRRVTDRRITDRRITDRRITDRTAGDGTQRGAVEVLLVHPGGPFWANKDVHGWSIPKGEYDPESEDAETAAVREFEEEIGHPPPAGRRRPLPPFKAGRKLITAWLVEGDLDPRSIASNHFEMEWPPKSGRMESFPEVDRAAWFSLDEAATKLHKGQLPLCGLIAEALAVDASQDSWL